MLSNPLFNVLFFERRDEVTRVPHKTSTDKHSINLKINKHVKGIQFLILHTLTGLKEEWKFLKCNRTYITVYSSFLEG